MFDCLERKIQMSNGIFNSNVAGTPAVSAAGTNGATGVDASSDTSNAIVAQTQSGDASGVWGNNTGGGTGVAVLEHKRCRRGRLKPHRQRRDGLNCRCRRQRSLGEQHRRRNRRGRSSTSGVGVGGSSHTGNAVTGSTAGADASGVWGNNTGGGTGVAGLEHHRQRHDGLNGGCRRQRSLGEQHRRREPAWPARAQAVQA